MNSVVHDFSVDLVLRVRSIPPSTYYAGARHAQSRRGRGPWPVQNLLVYWVGSRTPGVPPCWFR